MLYRPVAIAVGLISVMVMGCATATSTLSTPSSPVITSSPDATSPAQDRPEVAQAPAVPTQAQSLPITASAMIEGTTIQLEVAQTPEQQAMGLMFRSELADDRGMLFPFDRPRFTRFWMRNVEIPLDMIFMNGDEVVAIADSVPPCTETPCPTYGPDVPVSQVIELRGGRAAELGLEVGDRITIQPL